MDNQQHAKRIAEIRADHSKIQELPKVAHHHGIKHSDKKDYDLIDKIPRYQFLI